VAALFPPVFLFACVLEANVQSMRWLSNVHQTQANFSFRSFAPFMMKILEDANEVVRETAKEVVIELFKYQSPQTGSSYFQWFLRSSGTDVQERPRPRQSRFKKAVADKSRPQNHIAIYPHPTRPHRHHANRPLRLPPQRRPPRPQPHRKTGPGA
jgi:CLASP N terminal